MRWGGLKQQRIASANTGQRGKTSPGGAVSVARYRPAGCAKHVKLSVSTINKPNFLS